MFYLCYGLRYAPEVALPYSTAHPRAMVLEIYLAVAVLLLLSLNSYFLLSYSCIGSNAKYHTLNFF